MLVCREPGGHNPAQLTAPALALRAWAAVCGPCCARPGPWGAAFSDSRQAVSPSLIPLPRGRTHASGRPRATAGPGPSRTAGPRPSLDSSPSGLPARGGRPGGPGPAGGAGSGRRGQQLHLQRAEARRALTCRDPGSSHRSPGLRLNRLIQDLQGRATGSKSAGKSFRRRSRIQARSYWPLGPPHPAVVIGAQTESEGCVGVWMGEEGSRGAGKACSSRRTRGWGEVGTREAWTCFINAALGPSTPCHVSGQSPRCCQESRMLTGRPEHAGAAGGDTARHRGTCEPLTGPCC